MALEKVIKLGGPQPMGGLTYSSFVPFIPPREEDPTPPSIRASTAGLIQQGACLLLNPSEAASIKDSHSVQGETWFPFQDLTWGF